MAAARPALGGTAVLVNVRLYVERDGRPGVWFLSLDATSRLAVRGARILLHLPYHRAEIHVLRVNSLGAPHGLALDGPPARLHFARRADTVVWTPERVR